MQSAFPHIDEIQVSDDNSNWTTIKNIDYYSVSNSDPSALHGLVKQESVPDVGGSGEDMVTKYYYDETVNGLTVYRKSPTRVEYQWFNPATQQYEWVTSTTGYGHAGRALWTEDALGNRSDFTYDVMGRPKKRFEPSNDDERGQVSSVSYNSSTMRSTLTDNSKSWWTGQLVGTSLRIDTAAAAGKKDYVVLSNTSTSITVQGNLVYDGVQTNDSYKVAPFTETQYGTSGSSCSSCVGQVVWEKDLRGYKTYYSYNPAGRVVEARNDVTGDTSSNPLVKYVYDGLGQTKEVWTYTGPTCPGRKTSYEYDQLGRITKITYPTDSQSGMLLWNEYYRYDVMGNLVASIIGVVDGSGNITAGDVTAYVYDDLYRLVKVKYDYNTSTWPSFNITISDQDADVRYTYDGSSGLKTAMIEKHGTESLVSEYEYDGQGRLTSYTPPQPLSREITYTFNNLGQKTSVTNGNFRISYNYYANGWLKEVKLGFDPNEVVIAEYRYDSVGNRTLALFDNSTSTSYSYDNDLSSIIHSVNSTPNSYEISYSERDNAGNPLQVMFEYGQIQETTTYTYDALSRLDEVWYPGQQQSVDFGYDWIGNRENPPTYSNSFIFNKADQLIRIPGSHEYTYYGNGDLYRQYNDGKTQLQRTYEYTATGILRKMTYELGQSPNPYVEMIWDADNNRISFTESTNQNTWYYVYDVTAGIPAVIEEVTPSGSVYYIREPDGELIACCTGTSGQNILYYHFDELGSTKMLTDANGHITDMYEYDAWGSLTNHAGSANQPYQYVGRLGYYAHYQEQGLGLMQLGVRFYDAQTGIFTQRDPLQDGLSDYSYTEGHVLTAVDPSGLWFCDSGGPPDTGAFWGYCRDDSSTAELCDGNPSNDPGPIVRPPRSPKKGVKPPVKSQPKVGTPKKPTKGNFRKNLKKSTNTNPPSNVHAHHCIPQCLTKSVTDRWPKLDPSIIHDPKFGTWWKGCDHLKNSYKYKEQVSNWFIDNPNGTWTDFLSFLRCLNKGYGNDVHF